MLFKITEKLSAKSRPEVVCRFMEDGQPYDSRTLPEGFSQKQEQRSFAVAGNVQLIQNIDADEYLLHDEARRVAGGTTIQYASQNGAHALCWLLDGKVPLEHFCQLVIGAMLANYRFDEYRSKSRRGSPQRVLQIVAGANARRFRHELKRLEALSAGVSTARDLANLPANDLTPDQLLDFGQKLAKTHRLEFGKLSAAQLTRSGYAGITAVGSGSSHPPVLFYLRHKPKTARRSVKPLCFVGKGITFDAGGICIKPADKMWTMKADMGGAAAVIGALDAIARLALPIEVTGVIVAAENLPGSRAYRPGDVLTYRNGRSVEVHNTDAEGRLVLADGLLYAQERLKQKRIVDLATLTGACVRALGHQYIGLLSRSEKLTETVKQAATLSGELVWELPLHPEYRKLLRSNIADVKNIGGPLAGAQTAGWLLHEFIHPGTEFVHLDIAGVFYAESKSKYWLQEGATGAGVRLAVTLAELAAGLNPAGT